MSNPWDIIPASGNDTDKSSSAKEPASESSPLMKKRPSLFGDFGGFASYYKDLKDSCGNKLLLMIFFAIHCGKGFSSEFAGKAIPYMFKAYGVSAPQAQVYRGVAGLPWAMKPIVGLLSDVFPICGYNKAPYMVVTCLVSCVACAALALVPETMMPIGLAVVCLFGKSMQESVCDLLAEAKYAEKIRQHPAQGPAITTYVWFGIQSMMLVAIVGSGVALQHLGFRWMFAICSIPTGVCLLPLLFNYMGEECVTEERKAEARARVFAEKEMCFLCVVMLVGTVTLSITGLFLKNYLVNAILALAIMAVMLVCFSVLLSPTIAKINAFSAIQQACTLSTGGAAFYFFTDTVEEYPEGTHFSMFFYNSVLGTVACVVSLIGIWTYKRYLSGCKYRTLFIVVNIASVGFHLLDLLIFTHYNRKLGIPDQAFVLTSGALESIVEMWMWMPQVVMLAYMVPKGMEAIMFALLAGCHNLGLTVSANCGALLLDRLNVKPSGAIGEGAMFENLWIASLVGTLLPFVCLVALFWLIPNVHQTERFTDPETDSATAGSLWRQWMHSEVVDEELSQ